MTRPALPAALLAEIRKLDDAAVLTLLGEILEPSHRGPFANMSEEWDAELTPVTQAYQDAYEALDWITDPDLIRESAAERRADEADYCEMSAAMMNTASRP